MQRVQHGLACAIILPRKFNRDAKRGSCFFYHSNQGKEIVGICEVIKTAYPDPTAEEGEPWVVVDMKAVKPFNKSVSLAEIKKETKLQKMSLLTSARLSVQPVAKEEWQHICKMGDTKL